MTNLPQGWEVKKLGEIGEIVTGSTPSKSNLDFYGKDYPFFKPSDFEQGYFLENAGDNLSKLGFDKARQLPPKTILVVCIGSLGKVALTRVIGSCNQQINAIIPHKNIIAEYIYYYCISSKFQSILFSKAPQTTLAIFNKTEFSKLEIIYPKDIKEQERIVGILDESFAKIDESIKILEQNLLNLDELMQSALQKAFNPLKDNAKENYKLPQSWEWKSLEEISENISAGGDKPKNCTESKTAKNQIPVYANGVNNNGLVGYTDKATIIKPSLTISARGTIGFVCIRKEPYFPIVRLISLIPCENILCLHYLYFCLNFFIAKGEGSSIPQLTIPKFKSLQIPLPPLKEQEQIAEHLDFVFKKAKALKELYTKELQDYEELKQSLLNKAFKGEL
ncbi:TPA: restriction endonuclease subunit S [Campylobacter jejuni]|uniref:restriction endonuclease subunit S n=1 Tax=Campylobacter jejuni TaxID=197 RepID=UPI000B3F7C49|nr:restriction endonuclease subunit S [Campylobacter jejuni]EAI4946115.1 restriction endonuclease subunit S [Campylobacter jejuni]EDO9954690.1 restriction endonuclease subunit S [Campylobacter jejuni]EDP4163708.1 restriction endonuclease subunit S [Campylobacter jejuni]EDP4300468.1 restriction endonuclease subunit S [Campylobacter jejuni]EEL0768858.1 restriction endonuclease subunit S [Campylobacter jejuni]